MSENDQTSLQWVKDAVDTLGVKRFVLHLQRGKWACVMSVPRLGAIEGTGESPGDAFYNTLCIIRDKQ
jgi:hypothetical protein